MADLSDFGMMGVTEEAMALLEDRDRSGKAVPVFVYGTLRDGGRLHSGYSEGIVKIRHEATTSGMIYFPGHFGFPGARFDHEGTIIGDLLWYPLEARSLVRVIGMELSAGYSLVVVQATYRRATGRPHNKTVSALAFQHNRFDAKRFQPVPANDWNCAAAQQMQGY